MTDKSSAHILFLLSENVHLSLQRNQIGHIKEMEDIPRIGETFLIADSHRKTVLGPFRVTSGQHESETPVVFYRKLPGIPETERRNCSWLFEFEPDPMLKDPSRGMLWAAASPLAGIPVDWWRHIRQNRLTDDQFVTLCEVLLSVNRSDAKEDSGLVSYHIGGMTDAEWDDYLRSYYGDNALWGEDGEPLNHAADVQFYFNGDERAWQSNHYGHGG